MPGAHTAMLKPSRIVNPARKQLLATRAHGLRLFALEPERALWRELRGGRLGLAFRRQVVLGNRYIADFVALSLQLLVEVARQRREHASVAEGRILRSKEEPQRQDEPSPHAITVSPRTPSGDQSAYGNYQCRS
jgi:Protein of unknown function (DUF559)